MKDLLFEIDSQSERELYEEFAKRGWKVLPKGAEKRTTEGSYHLQAVLIANQEAFWFGIAEQQTGRRLLMIGSVSNRSRVNEYDSFRFLVESMLKKAEKL
jgi:hypothetical protein